MGHHRTPALDGVTRIVPAVTDGATSLTESVHHQLVWPLRSAVTVTTDRLSFVVTRPYGLWIPAGVQAVADASLWQARYDAPTCPPLWRRIAQFSLQEVVGPLLISLRGRHESPWRSAVEAAIVDHLHEALTANPAPLAFPSDPRAREVALALAANPASTWELSDWSAHVGASDRTLRRIFSAETGLSFAQWRLRLKVQRAIALLRDGFPVGEVAKRLGYRSPNAFARAVRAETGRLPSQIAAAPLTSVDPLGDWPEVGHGWPMKVDRSSYRPDAAPLTDVMETDLMWKSSNRVILAFAALALFIAACSDDETTESDSTGASERTPSSTTASPTNNDADDGSDAASVETRVVTDYADRSIEVPVEPKRVLAVNGRRTGAVLVSLGVEPVGWTGSEGERLLMEELADDDVDVATLEFFGSVSEPNLEAIAAAEIDLILQPFPDEAVTALYSDLAPVVVTPIDSSDSLDVERFIAELVGAEDRHDADVERYAERVAEVREQLGELSGLTYSYIEYFGPADTYVYDVDGVMDWFAAVRVFRDLGLVPSPSQEVADDSEWGGVQVSAERLADFDADLVFVAVDAETGEVGSGAQTVLDTTDAADVDQLFVISAEKWGYSPLASTEATLSEVADILAGIDFVDTPN